MTLRKPKTVLAAAVAATLIVAGAVGATTQASSESRLELDRANAIDGVHIAGTEDTTVANAKATLEIQQQAGGLIDRLRREHKGRLAGIYFADGDARRIVVRLTGNAAVAARPRSVQLDSGYVSVEYVYGAGKTQQALDAMLVRGMPQIKRRLPSLQGGYVDEKTGDIVLLVTGRDANRRSVAAALFADANVRLEVLPAPLQQQAMGGGHVTNGSYVCTAGFSIVDNTTGRYGITTAGHCSNNYNAYTGPEGTSSIAFTRESYNANSDWQLQNAGNVTARFVYNKSGTAWYTRAVTGVIPRASLAIGSSVCHYGRNSGYSCGTVSSTSFRPSWSCGGYTCNAVFVSVTGNGLRCLGGDSGGPWFSGSLAVGGHSGGSPTDASGRCSLAIFTSVDWLSAMNAGVLR